MRAVAQLSAQSGVGCDSIRFEIRSDPFRSVSIRFSSLLSVAAECSRLAAGSTGSTGSSGGLCESRISNGRASNAYGERNFRPALLWSREARISSRARANRADHSWTRGRLASSGSRSNCAICTRLHSARLDWRSGRVRVRIRLRLRARRAPFPTSARRSHKTPVAPN